MNSLFSKQTKELKRDEIKKIIELKNSFWKFNIKSQEKWFKKNVKKKDLHNFLFFNKKLIGYTLLRLRKIKNTKSFYFLLDTMIVKKEFRKKKYGKLLMEFNNHLISKNKKMGFLVCKKRETNFYKKFEWKNLSKKSYNFENFKNFHYGMIFNAQSKKMFYDFNQ